MKYYYINTLDGGVYLKCKGFNKKENHEVHFYDIKDAIEMPQEDDGYSYPCIETYTNMWFKSFCDPIEITKEQFKVIKKEVKVIIKSYKAIIALTNTFK